MYKQVFQRIVDASQNNSLTFFVGAGVSALSDAPKWSELINDICREMGREPKAEYTSDEYLRIPQMYYYSIDKDNEKYYTFLKGCFEKGELVPNTIHKMLLRFNPCSFITTNFDELLEDAAIQSAQGFKSIACDSEIASINGDRYILKVHGDLKHKNIVFKEEDYLNYSEKFKLTETVLKSIFSMNTVVFIGYGLNDYNAIESNALEMGLSSSGKAMCRINDYLHFLLCNGLYLDEFTEFKSAITNLMGLLVYKYSEQNKKKLLSGFPEGLTNEKVEFDEFDFYCFVEYFESKDILKLLNKYEIETIEFQNIDAICDAVTNLLQYYDQVLEKSKDFVEVISYQGKIKTCLTLLRFMNIPQKTVDAVCQFILKREYGEILINDKVLFLEQQLYRRKMYSAVTAKLIEDKLLFYIDSHIKAIEDGTKFELMSTSSSINYCNLVHYISSETGYHSRRLAMRVSKIIKLENPVMLRHVVEHYSHHVSPYQKAKIVKWAKESLKAKFDFKLLTLLMDNNAKISAEMIAQFQDFLRKEVGKYETTKNGKKSFEAFPEDENLFELNQAGYWCFLGYLKKAPFSEFLGKSDIFDFYFLFTHFDFAKFDVSWLITSSERALILISKRKIVRQKVREKIAEALQNGNLSKKDEAKLAQILAKHFC